MVERTILRVFRAVELQSMVVDSGNVRPPLRQKWSPGRHVDVRSAVRVLQLSGRRWTLSDLAITVLSLRLRLQLVFQLPRRIAIAIDSHHGCTLLEGI